MSDNKVIELKPGEFLIKEKDPCNGIFIIKEGQLEVFKTTNNGHQRIPLAVIGSGEYVGEIALFKEGPHTTTVQALTDVKAIEIPKEKIEEQLKGSPTWLTAMVKGLTLRLTRMNDLLKKNNLVDESLATSIKALETQAIKNNPQAKEAIESKPPAQ